MGNGNSLFDKGLEEYPLSVVLIENIVLALWIVLGTIFVSQISVIIGLIYIACALIVILVVMRKLLCTHCYYYGKRCHVGWGKISSILYDKGNLDEFSTCVGQKIAPIFFGLLALIPMIFGSISLLKNFMISKLILMILLLGTILYSSIVTRKESCGKCKMKNVCTGSAASTENDIGY